MTVEALLEAHTASRARVQEQVIAMLARQFRELGSWNRADLERFLVRALPVVTAGQRLTAQLVDVYAAQVLSELLEERIQPVGLDAASTTALRGVDPADVYSRPFIQLWGGLARGERFLDALSAAETRLLEISEDDLTLAYRRAALVVGNRQPTITGYRRVIRPELARKGGTCGLCIAAADQRYKTGELLPVHTHCHCAVVPIVGSKDPGRDINGQDISDLYRKAAADANSTSAKALSAQRYTVHEHGELGPLLMPKGQHFTGPADIPAAQTAA